MRQVPRSPLSFKLQRVANVPEHPPPSTRLMSCAHIANRRLSRIIGAKGHRSPAAGCGTTPDHLSHRYRCQWQGREGFRAQAVQGSELTVRFRASGWPSIDTREERPDNSLVVLKRGQNIVKNRRGGRSPPTTVSSSVRTREYLTTREIERLMAAARKSSRYGHRDATMILIGYRHGLRASELCDLQWSQVELSAGRLHVRRAIAECPPDAG